MLAHNACNMKTSIVPERPCQGPHERAAPSRPSESRAFHSSCPQPNEAHIKAAVSESQRTPALRDFIFRLCPQYNLELVQIEFGISRNANRGACPTVCVITRRAVSASARWDLEELILRMLHMMSLDTYGYRVQILAEAELEE